MTPEQEKKHQEKIEKLAKKNSKRKGHNRDLFTLFGAAVVTFFVAIFALGTLIYSIKKYNPHHTRVENQKIHNMDYDEVKVMQKALHD